MPLQVNCGNCGKSFTGDVRMAGKTGACPSCGASITIPPLNEKAPPPSAEDVLLEVATPAAVAPVEENPWPNYKPTPPKKEGPQKVVITSIRLSTWNMMELIITFWIATVLLFGTLWILFYAAVPLLFQG